MSIMYIMIVTINTEDDNDPEEYKTAKAQFRMELGE